MQGRFAVVIFMVIVGAIDARQIRQTKEVPKAIQLLRQPLTSISLREMYNNMNNNNTVTFYTNCVTGGTCDRVGAALRHFLVDLIPGQDICNGCNPCERERVQYVLDTMKEQYPEQACKVQTTLQKPIFSGGNPCA
ncbi:uncharacterized protein [Macrobrachium rosenbergii]|uniref:uncharacterized protein n=1 Tax=Macrobrachium rosenbergii TaxID=79674 RepID=UPI0034D540FC